MVKEAMACNCPVVSTDVGDVKKIISQTDGCSVVSHDERELLDALSKVLLNAKRTEGRKNIQNLSKELIASEILDVYQKLIV